MDKLVNNFKIKKLLYLVKFVIMLKFQREMHVFLMYIHLHVKLSNQNHVLNLNHNINVNNKMNYHVYG